MKSFRQFVLENKKREAPQGIIFSNDDKKAFVGKDHEKPLDLSDSLFDKIKEIGDKHGYWWEGTGGDIKTTTNFSDKKKYKGSWDDEFTKTLKGYPPEFLYTVFTNTNVNKQREILVSPNKTIFDSIMAAQTKIGYLKDRKFDEETLRNFLSLCSEKDGANFLEMSKLPATKENVNKFLSEGEKLMWPDKNWAQYPNRAGKLAEKVDIVRNQYLINEKAGVFFAGSGHLKELKHMLEKSKTPFTMIGGEDIA